jgi:hypothetical protein
MQESKNRRIPGVAESRNLAKRSAPRQAAASGSETGGRAQDPAIQYAPTASGIADANEFLVRRGLWSDGKRQF